MFWRNVAIRLIHRLNSRILIAFLIIVTVMAVDPIFAATNSEQELPAEAYLEWPAIGYGVGYLRFEHLGAGEGFPESSVNMILQDSKGFLWFGTQEGLNRYDGYNFKTYKSDPNAPAALSDAFITAAKETSDGSLWLGTYYGGLNRFDPSKEAFVQFTPDQANPNSLPDERVNVLFVDSGGDLWVGTRRGLSLLNPDWDGFTHYQYDTDDSDSLSSNHVLSLFEDHNNNLWVGTENGLNRFDRETGTFERFLTDIRTGLSIVTSISDGSNGKIWLGTRGGLVHFNTENYSYRIYLHDPEKFNSLSSNRINVVYQDRSGNLWIGLEDKGVNLVTAVSERAIQVIQYAHHEYAPNSLSHNDVRVIFEDRGGVMWFGTSGGGVNKVNLATRAFGLYQHLPENPNTPGGENITALAFDEARRSLWIGTEAAGLDRLDLISGEFVHYQHDPTIENSLDMGRIVLLYVGPRGNLYVSTDGSGIKYYDSASKSFLPVFSEDVDFRKNATTTAITSDSSGMLWLAQASGELLRVDPATGMTIPYGFEANMPVLLGDDVVQDIHVDQSGTVWLATENNGLVHFDPEQGDFSVFHKNGTSEGPSHNSLTDIYADRAGVLWIGTAGGGLNQYDPKRGEFVYYTTQNGLPSNRVFGIQEDDSGNLWLSTGNGLARFSPISGDIRPYDARDGLQGNTFNRNAHAAGGGALFFGGENGFNAFLPQVIEDNDHVPPVIITSVSLFDQVLLTDIQDCSASLVLTHNQNFLSFEFAALDYSAPDDNQYAYLMEGLNEEYVIAGNRRFADYPNLAWGEYTFHLIGSNNDGAWNRTGACVKIHIKPPFWATWQFITLVGLILAVSVVYGYQWRLRNIEHQRAQLALDVFERTQEIERRRQMASGLSEVVRLLNTNQPLEKSLDFIVKQSIGLTSASKAAIFERQGDQVLVRACYPEGEIYTLDLKNPHSASGAFLRESTFINRLLIVSRVDSESMKSDTCWELVSGNYRTAFCTPLLVEDNVYGGLVLYYGEDRIFTADEINLAHTLADQASLAIANEQLKVKVQDTAVTAERNRLARDLHDAVTQTLFSTSLIAEVLPKIWEKDPSQAEVRLEELRQMTRGALGEMRTLLMELRPSALRDADPAELFKHLIDAFTGRTGVTVQVEIDAAPNCDFAPDVKNVFYRIAQEGLNNILKHAEATKVWFHFSCDSEVAALTIIDNGAGFDLEGVPRGHLGLNIMRERSNTIGADLNVVSQVGEGTTLRLVWHIEKNKIKLSETNQP